MTKFFFLGLILFSTTLFSQTKKVKIKGDKSVSFFYEKDSCALTAKENKKIIHSVYQFYNAFQTKDYQNYLDCLSPNTLTEIRSEKLERKYKKFQRYNIRFKGKLNVRSIHLYQKECFENAPVYICIIQLPKGDTIQKRVGFDPLIREVLPEVENHVGLHLVLTPAGYKVVIPW